jgi:Cu/Ag efflux pump CusA
MIHFCRALCWFILWCAVLCTVILSVCVHSIILLIKYLALLKIKNQKVKIFIPMAAHTSVLTLTFKELVADYVLVCSVVCMILQSILDELCIQKFGSLSKLMCIQYQALYLQGVFSKSQLY